MSIHHRIRRTVGTTVLSVGLAGTAVLALAATAPNAGAASAQPACIFAIRHAQSGATPACGVQKAPVLESLTASQNPVTEGEAVTFTVSVAAASGAGVPSGTITFSSIDPVTQLRTPLASATLDAGSASWTTTTLPVGTNGLYAGYGGDFVFNQAYATYDEQVVPAPPATPVVSSLAPAKGPVDGGTVVTITGANLDSATAIRVGTVAVTSFSCPSSTTCTFVTPAGSGHPHVRVTSPAGTSATSKTDRFSYKSIKP